jgi:hypothetical protein
VLTDVVDVAVVIVCVLVGGAEVDAIEGDKVMVNVTYEVTVDDTRQLVGVVLVWNVVLVEEAGGLGDVVVVMDVVEVIEAVVVMDALEVVEVVDVIDVVLVDEVVVEPLLSVATCCVSIVLYVLSKRLTYGRP